MEVTSSGNTQQQRNNLYSKLWNAVKTIQVKLGDWEFKSYLFSFLFFKYASDKSTAYAKSLEGTKEEVAQKIRDFEEQRGYFIPQFASFEVLRDRLNKLCYDPIEELTTTIRVLKQVNKNQEFNKLLSWIGDASYNLDFEEHVQSGKALKQIVNAVAELDIDLNDDSIDFIGDIYEYLVGINDKNSRKVAGQYYTPREVAELLALITTHNNTVQTAYDPTCGSGGLLMAVRRKAPKAKLYGQEINQTSVRLCRMNMFTKVDSIEDFKILKGDTLEDDKFKDEQFDAVVGNPPFSLKWEGNKSKKILEDPRFEGLIAPAGQADWAFLQHAIHHLKDTGIAAITCFPGILYRDRIEKKIREHYVKKNYIDAVIQLPENLFYGTTIPVSIIVFKKNKTDDRILFIDASQQCVRKPVRNYLSEEHIQTIFNWYKDRKKVEGICEVISREQVEHQGYNLNVSDYVQPPEEKPIIHGKVKKKQYFEYLKLLKEADREILDKYYKMVEEAVENFMEDEEGYFRLGETQFKNLTEPLLANIFTMGPNGHVVPQVSSYYKKLLNELLGFEEFIE